MLKVSIVTVVYNDQKFIENAIESVFSQTFPNIEYIVIDGGSTDGTLDKIKKYSDRISKIVSEKDKGIYDAMNKGITLASGDIVGILNSDDIYAYDGVIDDVVKAFQDSNSDCSYGDLAYVDQNITKTVRLWKSCPYKENLFSKGWMPPHPTFFVRRSFYEKLGGFDLRFSLAADFELLFRFLHKGGLRAEYIPRVLIKMRLGGKTNKSFWNIIKQNIEIMEILAENKVGISPFFLFSKAGVRLRQFLSRGLYTP